MNQYEKSPEDEMLSQYMDDMRDDIIEGLSKLERAALFQDFDEFKYQWNKEKAQEYYENI